MSFDWDEAVSFALTLPGVTMGPGARGSTSPQVRGQQIVSQSRTPGDFVLRATREEIGVLIETDPGVSGRHRNMRAGPACWCDRQRPIRSGCAC